MSGAILTTGFGAPQLRNPPAAVAILLFATAQNSNWADGQEPCSVQSGQMDGRHLNWSIDVKLIIFYEIAAFASKAVRVEQGWRGGGGVTPKAGSALQQTQQT
ncbi:hypothetical protein ACO0LO_12275 [Undibacterium sp. TJN25]|uniref:hypothetical protein n=1 Tax=Undibacterium sp. TJN25 TaxID=3413056 RepID=UPI003BF0BF5E